MSLPNCSRVDIVAQSRRKLKLAPPKRADITEAAPPGFWQLARFSRSETEGVGLHYFDFDVVETRGFQAFRESVGVDDHHGVEEVQEAEGTAVQAVGSGENGAGAEDSGDFRE